MDIMKSKSHISDKFFDIKNQLFPIVIQLNQRFYFLKMALLLKNLMI